MARIILVLLSILFFTGCKSDGTSGTGTEGAGGFIPSNSGAESRLASGNEQVTTAGKTQLAELHNPEPSTILLLGFGAAAMAAGKLRKKFKK